MSLESDDNQASKPVDLVFILAIAGRIDAQTRILAQTLEKDGTIYYGYAALDAISSSYSMFKYFFDIFVSNDSDAMHEMMMTPGGIAAIAAESIFLVGFALLACRFDKEKSDSYKKMIANAWPYFRDVIKGLKNAYKGWKSTVTLFKLLGGVDLKYTVIPVGVLLGVLAAVNRLWLRNMVELRKVMMNVNSDLLLEIKRLPSLTKEEREAYLSQIQYQSYDDRSNAFLLVGAGGLIDGLYLYVGVLGLAALSFPMLAALTVICAIYTLGCIITRIYEEYDFQMRLFITQTKCKLALITKEMDTVHRTLLVLRERPNKTEEEWSEIKRLEAELCDLIESFEKNRHVLREQTRLTYLSAGLLGIKNGLYAYSAFSSILFLVATILTLSGVAFPPALLIFSVLTGLLLVAGFFIQSLIAHHQHTTKEEPVDDRPYQQLIDMRNDIIVAQEYAELLDVDTFRQSVKDGLFLDASPQFFFQEWFEVIRSLFSGLGKGQKFIDFAANPLQEVDEQGHYHDGTVMNVLSLFSAALFGIVLSLRALARGLGRPPLGQIDLAADIEPKVEPEVTETQITESPIALKEPAAPIAPQEKPLPRSKSFLSYFSFFPPEKNGELFDHQTQHTDDKEDLITDTTLGDITPDLS